MKKLLKLLLPLVAIAMLVGALCLAASAADSSTVYFTVTDSAGNVTEYKTADFGQVGSLKGVTVELKKDVKWTSTANVTVTGTNVIKLNGYKFQMDAYKSSGNEGRINYNADNTSLTFEGLSADGKRGVFSASKTQSRIFTQKSGSVLVFNNVDISAAGVLADMRFGKATLNNCTLNTAGSHAFSLANVQKNGAAELELNNVDWVSSSSTRLINVGRSDATQHTETRVTFNGGSVTALVAENLMYCNTNISDTAEMNLERHEVVFNGVCVTVPRATLFGAANGDVSNGYRFVVSALANTELYMASPAVAITSPSGYVKARIGSGNHYKVVLPEQTCQVSYVSEGSPTMTFQMLKGAEPGTTKPFTPTYYVEDGRIKTDDYCAGWKDADGNLVTSVTEDTTLYAEFGHAEAIWAGFSSEGVSLENLVYVEFENKNLRSAISKTLKPAYVYIFEDMEYSGNSDEVENFDWDIVVDLGGNTLTMQTSSTSSTNHDFTVRPTSSKTFTFRNGKVDAVNCKVAYPTSGGKFVASNCDFRVGVAFVDARGGDFTLTDCTVDYVGGSRSTLFSLSHLDSTQTALNSFKNVRVYSSNGSTVEQVFSASRNKAANVPSIILENVSVDLKVTKNVINVQTATAATVSVKSSSFNTESGAALFNFPNATSQLSLTVDGITYDAPSCISSCALGALSAPAGVSAYNGKDGACYTLMTEGYQTDLWRVLDLSFTTYTAAGVVPVCNTGYIKSVDADGNDKLYYLAEGVTVDGLGAAVAGRTYEITVDGSKMQTATYAELSANGDIIAAYEESYLTEARLSGFAATSVLTLYTDISITECKENVMKNIPDGLVIDLNGNTLTLTDGAVGGTRFGYVSVTVKDGTIVNTHNFVYNDVASAVLTFKNVDFSLPTSSNQRPFDMRKGTLVLEDCTVESKMATFSSGNRGNSQKITVKNTTIKTESELIRISPVQPMGSENAYTLSSTYEFIGCTIETSACVAYSGGEYLSDASTLNVTFTNTAVKAARFFDESQPLKESFTANAGCKFSIDPTDCAGFACSKGVVLVKANNADYPYLTLAESEVARVSANLTIYSDFVLNFYLPASAYGITVNGAPAEGTEFEGSLKVSAPRASALDIADGVTVAYSYKLGNLDMTDSFTYSVIDYMYAVLEGEHSASAKKLIAGAARYCTAVFAYANTELSEELAQILTLAGYTENVGESAVIPASEADYSALTEYVKSIQLSLGTTVRYVINFKSGFEGNVTVNGVEVDAGSRLQVTLRASDFADGLTLTVNGATGTYDLAAYYAGVKGTDSDLDALLVALYGYSQAAKAYVSGDSGKPESDPDKEVFEGMQSVFLIGQSNMAGRGDAAIVEPISDDRIYMLRSGAWVKMQEPIHDDKSAAGIGLGASFAKAFVETFGNDVGLIPGAFGGSKISDWKRGGIYYERALAMAKAAQQTSDICAILWHQGESDMGNKNYEADLKEVLDAFIEDLGLDADKIVIITGELGEFKGTSRDNHTAQINALADDYKNYAVASSTGLIAQDVTTHFDAPSLRVFGYRYFAHFYRMITGKTYSYIDDVEHYRKSAGGNAGGGDSADNTDYITHESFDGLATGSVSGTVGGNNYSKGGGNITVVQDAANKSNKYVSLERISSSSTYIDFMGNVNAKSTVVYEASFMMELDGAVEGDLLKMVMGSSSICLVYVKADGTLYNHDGKNVGASLGVKLSDLEWTTIKVVVHLDTNTKDVYIGGSDTPILSGVTLCANSSIDTTTYAPAKCRTQLKGGDGVIYVDDFKCYYEKK